MAIHGESELLDQVVAAVAAKIGGSVGVLGEPLPAGPRCVVARLVVGDGAGTVIVKGYRSAARANWVREAAALRSLAGYKASAPGLVLLLDEPLCVVMEDVGTGSTLADLLMGSDQTAAEEGLVSWAKALAALHACTWGNTKPFAAALGELAGPVPVPVDPGRGMVVRGTQRLVGAARAVGLDVPDVVLDEIRCAVDSLGSGPLVLSPSDACPDNNVRTEAGTRLIDFEGASATHPAWDLAYLRVPWPTCWCAWRLPDSAADVAEAAYRSELTSCLAERGIAADWVALAADTQLAAALWAIGSAGYFLDSAAANAPPGADRRRPSPSDRARVQHSLTQVQRYAPSQLSATNSLAQHLLATLLAQWGRTPVQAAPAFRKGDGELQIQPSQVKIDMGTGPFGHLDFRLRPVNAIHHPCNSAAVAATSQTNLRDET
jgi:hypothetical protein